MEHAWPLRRLERWVPVLFAAVFALIWVQIVFFNSSYGYSPLLQGALIGCWLVFCAGVAFFGRRRLDWLRKNRYKLLAAAVVLLFCIQFAVGVMTEQTVDHDYGKVYNGAVIFTEEGNSEAFQVYKNYYHHFTNQAGPYLLLQLLFGLMKSMGLTCYYQAAVLLGHLLFAAALVCTFRYLDKAFGPDAALWSLLFWLCYLPVWFQSSILYTDTMTVAFAPAVLLLWEGSKTAPTKWGRLGRWAAMGLLLGLGGQIKATVLICGIAILCEAVLAGGAKRLCAAGLTVLVFCAGFTTLFTDYTYRAILEEERVQNEAMPITYWLMMGLMGDGAYNPTDEWTITCSVVGLEARTRLNLEKIEERLTEMGPVGYLQLLHRKTCRTFGSGNGEVNYLLCRGPLHPERFVYQIISTDGALFRYFDNLAQAVYSSFYLFAIGGAVLAVKKKDERILRHSAPFFSLMGFYAFMMLWESNHRLLVNQWPLFIIAASAGIVLCTKQAGFVWAKRAKK